MTTKKMKKQTKAKCAYCYGLGLDADLWGAGYRWPTKKTQNAFTPRVACDRCGVGATPDGEAHAQRSRNRLEGAKKNARQH